MKSFKRNCKSFYGVDHSYRDFIYANRGLPIRFRHFCVEVRQCKHTLNDLSVTFHNCLYIIDDVRLFAMHVIRDEGGKENHLDT